MSRAETGEVANLGGWSTTIVARVCLNMLRSRNVRRKEPPDVHLPDPVISSERGLGPEDEALLADSVGLALLVVLDALAPAERLAERAALELTEQGTRVVPHRPHQCIQPPQRHYPSARW
jgi:DNA-directed RNA polymerase specialized sigma24 family protein